MNEKLKENLIPIILGVLLLASIVGNIVLFNKVSGNNDSVIAMSTQLATSESQIQDLQNQLNSLQEQIEEKEAVINELMEIQAELESSANDEEVVLNRGKVMISESELKRIQEAAAQEETASGKGIKVLQ